MNNQNKVIVIGAGAAGLMAAVAASDQGASVTIYEQNEKPGKKIYITGKGRCNYSNACEVQDFFDHVVTNPRFLYSAVYDFTQQDMTDFLETNGCPTKVERGLRCFPASDHASDVTKALVTHLQKNHVRLCLHTRVKSILTRSAPKETDGILVSSSEGNNNKEKGRKRADSCYLEACGVCLENGQRIPADAVILATGGLSYASTGATGDGYRFASSLGIEVSKPAPSLVPLTVQESWPAILQGLSLKNVAVSMVPAGNAGRLDPPGNGNQKSRKRDRALYSGFGEMMFTHFGVTGPLILSASSYADFNRYPAGFILYLDLKPALTTEQLTERLCREMEISSHKEFRHAIRPLFPERLSRVMACLFAARQLQVSEDTLNKVDDFISRKAYTFTRKELGDFACLVKAVPMTVTGTRGFNEAIITRGGISTREINPSTMETKKVQRLFVAGELIDVNAQTGGFNLQIAWSTGHLAGSSAAVR